MKSYSESLPDGKEVITVIPDDSPMIVADGFGPGLIGLPMLKLTLVQDQVGIPGQSALERTVVATLQLPALALLEMADKVKQLLNENPALADAYMEQARSTVARLTS